MYFWYLCWGEIHCDILEQLVHYACIRFLVSLISMETYISA